LGVNLVNKTFWTNEHGLRDTKFEFTSFIETRLANIEEFSQKIASAIPEIREILNGDIKRYNESPQYNNLVGIDGSNTTPNKDPYLTTFNVNAVGYLQFKSKNPPARFLKSYELISVPTPNFSSTYMHLRRDILEMKALLKITDESKADIVFMDGSINSQALWNARMQQLKISPYIVPDTSIDLYKRIFKTPDGLWSKVIERLKSVRVVWIPKRIVGKSFVNRLLRENPDLDIPSEATNEVFSLILQPDEILGPFTFEKWVQTSTSTARKFVKDIQTLYYKPPFRTASAIKLEFHKNFLPDLEKLIATIKKEYSIYYNQIKPMIWAHTIAKNENMDLNGLDSAVKRLAILNCKDSTLRSIIQTRFANQFY